MPDDGPPRNPAIARPLRWAIGATAGVLVVAACWKASSLGDRSRTWAVVAIIGVAIVVADSLPEAQRLMPRPGMVPFVIGNSLAAMYGCVPETGQIARVAVVVAAVVVIELVSRRPPLVSWHAALVALVLWAGIFGATGRQSALVGALFAFWPVVIVPLVALLRPSLATTAEPVRWIIAGIGAVASAVVSRTGALQPTIRPALRAVVAAGGVSLVVALLVAIIGSSWSFSATPRRRLH